MEREILVGFANEKVKSEFEELKEGKFEDKQLYEFINRAIDDLKKNHLCGTKIPRSLAPKEYAKEFDIDNLFKYDLPNAWRLIYTLKGDQVIIMSVILEWMNHKNYERKFGYTKN